MLFYLVITGHEHYSVLVNINYDIISNGVFTVQILQINYTV